MATWRHIFWPMVTLAFLAIIGYTFNRDMPQTQNKYKESKLREVTNNSQTNPKPTAVTVPKTDPPAVIVAKQGPPAPLAADRAIRHNGTQKPMPVSGEVETALKIVGARSIDRPSREAVQKAMMMTGCDASHYQEMVDSVAAHQTQNPGRKIVFYDLGLNDGQVKEIKTWCNVEYRKFNYSLYPPHVRNLHNYAWKVFLILDLLKDYDAVIWIDASIRFTCKEIIGILALTAGESGVAVPLTGFPSSFCYTHPGMYDYIASNLSIVQTTPMFGGGFLTIVNSKEMFSGFIEWFVRCAFVKECMVAGSVLNCPHPNNYFTHWVGCHRYDQSAINLLLLHHFKGDISKYTSFTCSSVERGVTKHFKLKAGKC